MVEIEQNEIKKDIKETKTATIGELLSMVKYSLGTYLRSFQTFGSASNLTKDAKNILLEFLEILRTERTMLNYLARNAQKIDYDEACDLLDELDAVNEKTVNYYFDCLDGIEDACDTRQEHRGIRFHRDFKTVTEDTDLQERVLGLTITNADIKDFLDYEADFWEYIKPQTHELDPKHKNAPYFYGVFPRVDTEGKITGMNICVPRVVNLQTALVNVHELKHAHDIYELLGETYTFEESSFEPAAQAKEHEFKKAYFKSKIS